eukprot:scaffold46556_cov63-Phaeocystis_antarctica.AAC.1
MRSERRRVPASASPMRPTQKRSVACAMGRTMGEPYPHPSPDPQPHASPDPRPHPSPDPKWSVACAMGRIMKLTTAGRASEAIRWSSSSPRRHAACAGAGVPSAAPSAASSGAALAPRLLGRVRARVRLGLGRVRARARARVRAREGGPPCAPLAPRLRSDGPLRLSSAGPAGTSASVHAGSSSGRSSRRCFVIGIVERRDRQHADTGGARPQIFAEFTWKRSKTAKGGKATDTPRSSLILSYLILSDLISIRRTYR